MIFLFSEVALVLLRTMLDYVDIALSGSNTCVLIVVNYETFQR